MKNVFFVLALAAGLLVAGCKGGDAGAANTAGGTTTATVDKTVKKGELKKVLGKEIEAKFGLDAISSRAFYNASYEYYVGADGKEVLHGKFVVETAETSEEFVGRLKPADKEEGEPEVFELYFEYSDDKFEGQYVDGVKDGKMTFKMVSHESGGNGYIIYDAKTKGATSAKYDGAAESLIITYDGPVKVGTFKELFELTEEKSMMDE